MNKNVITIGLFDKDTKSQIIPKDEAIEVILSAICKRGLCATVQTEGIYGVYIHEDGMRVIEPSIRIELAGVNRKTIIPLIHELRIALNQESIMWECINRSPIKFVDVKYK